MSAVLKAVALAVLSIAVGLAVLSVVIVAVLVWALRWQPWRARHLGADTTERRARSGFTRAEESA